MSNVRVPVELYAQLTLGCLMGEDGLVDISDSALSAMNEIVKKAQRTSTRKERVDLSDPIIMAQKKAELTALLAESSAAIAAGTGKILPEYKVSLRIGLGKVTVTKNSELHNIYMTYARIHSNAAPSTLNNDPDDYFDSDD